MRKYDLTYSIVCMGDIYLVLIEDDILKLLAWFDQHSKEWNDN